MKRSLLEVLKDWSALLVGGAALLYIFGFTVHWAYFRLLGLEIGGQPLDYLRFAADYVTSVVSSLPQLLFAFAYYSPKLIHAPLLTSTIFGSLIVAVAGVLYVWGKPPRAAQKRKQSVWMLLWWSLNGMIIVSLLLLLQTEFDIAKLRNVLQPVDAAEIQQMQNQLPPVRTLDNTALLEIRGNNVGRIYKKYTETQRDSPGYHYFNEWFNPTITPNSSTERRAVYLALLLTNIVLLLAVVVQLFSFKATHIEHRSFPFSERISTRWSRMVITLLGAGLLMQGFLFPFVYATLGRNLTYPVVMLRIATPSETRSAESKNEAATSKPEANATAGRVGVNRRDDNWTHCVYLIAELDNEVVVYDRLNFFQAKRIPRNRILTISQLFAASPFESCSKEVGKFIPCETLWMSEETQILDF